jgi:alpha-galactosidase
MKQLITFDSESKVFNLSNDHISYIFSIEVGNVLSHHYFGKAVKDYHNQLKSPRQDRGFSGNLPGQLERGFSLDTILREYSSNGEGDFRAPSVLIRQSNGSIATHFTYQSHEIIKGKPKLEGLPAVYVEDDNEAETLVITLLDEPSQVELRLLYTIFRDRSLITRSSQLVNRGKESVTIEKSASMSFDLCSGEWDLITLPGAHVNERHLERHSVGYGLQKISSRRGTSSHQLNSFIALAKSETNEHAGDVFGFSLVYSGNHSFEVERDQNSQTRIIVGINEEQFSWELKANELFQSPEAISVYSSEGFNRMSQTFHSVINERVVRGKYKKQIRPILVNNWEATYFDFNEDKLKPIVDEARELGIEMFVLDDGWFGHRDDDFSSLGDWYVDETKFPNGLNNFANYVHEKGLRFGLWFEPEMISIDSELYRQHPEYMLKVPNRSASPSRNQFVLDFGRDEVRKNILNQMETLLDEGYVDYIKWDMNRHLSDVYSHALSSDRQGEVFHRYVIGLYDLLEKLTSKYPDILWEGCSGGGGRFDIGFAYYMPQSWTSDNTDAIARIGIQYGTSYAYPPSVMTAHVSAVPNHQTGRITPFKTRGDVAMSGVLGYELDLTKLTDAEKQLVKEQIEQYKAIRQVIQFGTFIRLKSPVKNNDCAWMFVDEEKNEAIVFVFRVLSQAQEQFILTKLSGLDPEKKYQNTESGEVFGGDELMNLGIYQTLENSDFVSWRYHFKAID